MKPWLFLDLDGVLVDFSLGAYDLHGKHMPASGQNTFSPWEEMGLTQEEFWAPMGQEFWSGLGWTEEGRELLARCESLFGDRIVLMTSPCLTPGCAEGKREWVSRELPGYERSLSVGACKHGAAAPWKVLVDDFDQNVKKFRNEGGLAVCPPRPWNARSAQCLPGGRFDVRSVVGELRHALDLALEALERYTKCSTSTFTASPA